MTERNRLEAGGRIDRSHPLEFRFDGRSLTGYRGDTLASALLANGVHLVGRSFKYHRPRGVLGIGAEEPNALVQVARGAQTEPNVRATQLMLYEGLEASSQNRWPSLAVDLGGLADLASSWMPAGFYYKTFMWPARLWPFYERAIRRMAGLGRAPAAADPDDYDHMHAHCDVLVVGAGAAGLAAALAAARCGARVILADDQSEAGGQLLGERYEIGGRSALAWVSGAMAELRAMSEVRVLQRTTITGHYDHGYLIGCQVFREPGQPDPVGVPRQRLWKIRARRTVIAAGSIERPLVFPDNDRPGIMLAFAARAYCNRYGVRSGSRVVVVTACDDAYRTALDLAAAGVGIAAVVDLRPSGSGHLPRQVRARGIEVLIGQRIVGVRGRARVEALRTQSSAGGAIREIACDLVAMSAGWIPSVHLFSQARGELQFDERLGVFVPLGRLENVVCVGAARGTASLRGALQDGFFAGQVAAQACGLAGREEAQDIATVEPEEAPLDWRGIFGAASLGGRQFVDFQNDVTVDDVRLAVREGYDAPEHLKRYTTAGMGVDQGRTGNINVLALLAEARAEAMTTIAPTTFRPPYQALSFGAIAGALVGPLHAPTRKTPMHDWHAGRGAVFENVGQWKRPRHYPSAGETLQAAVDRECLAVRRGVAIADVSTLGNIDVQGPDAEAFIDRIYCTRMSALGIGRCRYGLMLRQDGMIFDDGIAARLGEQHYLVSTTTAGAASVFAWMEEWLQTEWPDLRVYCTSVTEHYAQIALSGPRSLELLGPLVDIELDAMPFMSMREARVAGVPARVFRLSYTGGPGFEIAVPAGRAYELWTTLFGAGERFGIIAYGTEAMHVLRAERGFIMVGHETDGSVTPGDLGFEGRLAMDKPFIGKRSLRRADLLRLDRKRLVGLLTQAPDCVLPEGAQLLDEPIDSPQSAAPVAMIGHVTSSYFSAHCARSIALGLVRGGQARLGDTLYAWVDGRAIEVTVTAPRFLDAAGKYAYG